MLSNTLKTFIFLLTIYKTKTTSNGQENEENNLSGLKIEQGEYVNPQGDLKIEYFINTTLVEMTNKTNNENKTVLLNNTEKVKTSEPIAVPQEKTIDDTDETEVPMPVGPEPKRRKKPKKLKYNNRDLYDDSLVGPRGLDDHEVPTCDDFSKFARFNPYSVADIKWICFYYWSPESVPLSVEFFVPTNRELKHFQKVMASQITHPIDWNAKLLFMKDVIFNATGLLVEQSDRGYYLLYPYLTIENQTRPSVEPLDVRFKQTGDNKYLAIFFCDSDKVYILSRRKDIPTLAKMPDAVARLGYRSRGGKSYLYQGHEWMPIPEIDEVEYWTPSHLQPDDMIDSRDELGMDDLHMLKDEDLDFFH